MGDEIDPNRWSSTREDDVMEATTSRTAVGTMRLFVMPTCRAIRPGAR